MTMRSVMASKLLAGCWLLSSALGCSSESAVVGGNHREQAAPNAGAGGGADGDGDGGRAVEQPRVDRLTRTLEPIRDDPGRCMPYPLPLEADGTAACKIFTTSTTASACDCGAANRAPVSPAVRQAILERARQDQYCDQPQGPACEELCVCEDLEAVGRALDRCLEGDAETSDGWCYVDPSQGIGTLSTPCENGPQVRVRFNGHSGLDPAERAYLACSDATDRPRDKRALGEICVPSDEANPAFGGFETTDVVVDAASTSCASGVCLVQNFQGRVSCPFGNLGEGSCRTPGSNEPVTAPVVAQLVARPPSLAATCSCRCAGPGDGPFCACGEGQECVPLVAALGLAGDDLAGSYCVPQGATGSVPSGATCNDDPDACGGRTF